MPDHIDSEITIAHPSSAGTLPHIGLRPRYDKPPTDPKKSASWMSLTELTSERICLDFGAYVANVAGESNAELTAMTRHIREDGYYLRTRNDERRFEIVEERPNQVLEKHMGKVKQYYTAETGNRVTECTKKLENRYGTVVGCERYEERNETAEYSKNVDGVVSTRFGGFRMCVRNDGMIGPDATELFIANRRRGLINTSVYRVALTGGTRTAGAWGGRGGISGLEPPPGAPGTSAPAPATAPPASATPAAPAPPAPGSLDEKVIRHATGRVKVTPFKIVDPDGRTSFELKADGALYMGGSYVATYESNGLVRTPKGASMALDRNGVIWVAKRNTDKVVEYGRINGNKLVTYDLTFTYQRGTFTAKRAGQPPITYLSRFEPANIPAQLALFFIGTQNPNYFRKQK